MFIYFFSAIPVGIIAAIYQAMKNRSLGKVIGYALGSSGLWGLSVGFSYLLAPQITEKMDPGDYWMSLELWHFFILPFQMMISAFLSLLIGWPVRDALNSLKAPEDEVHAKDHRMQ